MQTVEKDKEKIQMKKKNHSHPSALHVSQQSHLVFSLLVAK